VLKRYSRIPVAQPHEYETVIRRWLQDTSKSKLTDVSFFRAPPFLFPRIHPRFTRRLMKTSAPEKKNGLIETFSRVYPKKSEHAPGI